VLVGASTLLRSWAGQRIPGLWIAPDEMIYGELAQSLYRSGELAIGDGPTLIYSVLYPALLGLPLALDDLELGYELAKALQALVMSLTAVPVYFWARSLMSRGWALTAGALSLAIPGLLYSGLLMTEVLFYPVVVVAAWALARSLEQPTPHAQALLVTAIVAAVATRLQAFVLVPVLVSAVGLKVLFDRSTIVARRLWPTFASLGLLVAAWAGLRLAEGGPWTRLLGSYGEAATGYDVADAARFIVYHLGAVLILSAVFPVCALLLLAVDATAGRERSNAARAYVAVAVSITAWFVVEVGIFASRHVERLAERDLLPLAPILFIGFCAWLGRGGPRPWLRTTAVALLALLPLLSLPLDRLVTAEALPDAFSIVPLYLLAQDWSQSRLELVVFGGGAVALAAFAVLPRRLLALLPAAAFVALGLASVSASIEIAKRATYDHENLVGGDHRWIDRAAERPVAYVYDGEAYWNGVWQQLFWNREVKRVYSLGETFVPGPTPQQRVRPAPDGRLLLPSGAGPDVDQVVASSGHSFVGSPIARIQQRDIAEAGLVLWRVEPPLRLSSVLTGVRPEGDMHQPGRLTAYDCAHGRLELVLLPKESTMVEVWRNGKLYERVDLRGLPFWTVTIPGVGARCVYEVRGNGLLGSTRFEFVRS
jgi:hypothetical protein